MNNETGKSDIYSIASAVARYLEECEKHTQSVSPQRSGGVVGAVSLLR